MSSSSQASVSPSQFELIFNAALNLFKEKTGKSLLDDWLAKELQNCDSVDAVMDIIQGQAKAFDKFRNGDSKLMKWVRSSVHVLYTISAALGDGVGVAIPSAKAVFTGIGVLLAAAKDVWASHDVLVDLFERIQFFLKRLGVHTRISPTKDLVEILVKIMAEVIGILSIATKEMQQSKTKIYLRKLLGRTDIEDALKKLDSLTQEEVRMAIAQVLQGINELKDDAKKINGAMQQIAAKVDKIEWNQIEQDVRKWLSSPDPTVNYNIARKIYQEGTAVWFLEGGIFKEWDLIGSLLWIHGKPGSGKSILCTSIIKHVISLCDAGLAALAYYYFDFRDEEKRNLRSFVTSLLTQLSDYSEHCRNIILRLYSTHDKGARQPDTDVLIGCLKEMLKVIPRQPVYIIVDALDECPGMSGMPTPRETVLDLVEDLARWQLPFLHLCITSRPEADIKEVLEPLAHCVVSLHDENGQQKDILDYVKAVVSSDRKMRKWRDEEKKLVVEELSKKVDGMFRWAFCQLEVLRHCLPASIRPTLDQLPDTLDETYARVLGQISQANQAHAHRLLQCLMVAVRPLRVEELAEVLAFEFDTDQGAIPRYRTDWQLNDQEQAVLSTCSSLVAIVDDKGSQVVQFSHFSVKEFLMSDRLTSSLGDFSRYHIHPRPAHTILAQACLGFLLYDPVDKECVKGSPLAEYAAQHWAAHAQFGDVASRVKDAMVSLFDYDKPHFAAWIRIYDIDESKHHRWPQPEISNPLYYSSLCGFSDLVEHLAIKHPRHVNAVGGRHKLPLLAALAEKHVEVAEILLKHGANVDIGIRERTTLHEAITDVGKVQFLLDHGADVNCRRDDLSTPLHRASRDGELKVARVLLKHEATVDPLDNLGRTPMHLLYQGKNGGDDILDLVQLLLEHGADINRRDKDNNTPLHLAMGLQETKCAAILLGLGADPRAENYAGQTPLGKLLESFDIFEREGHDEHKFKHFDAVRLSVEHGADMNIRTQGGRTLLHEAAFRGWPDIAKVLLDHGANASAETECGVTPLHTVSRCMSYEPQAKVNVAQLLLACSADVNFPDESQNTPLHSAALNGRLDIAQVLLDHGANTGAPNDKGKTPLHLVQRDDRDFYDEDDNHDEDDDPDGDFVRLLLGHGADLHAEDEDGNTALHSAAFEGRLDVVQALLEHGADADTKNDQGETPLHRVLWGQHHDEERVDIARLLLEHDVDVDARDKTMATPLHIAAFVGKPEIAQVLLYYGANADVEKVEGEILLNLVSRSDHGSGVAQLLLEFDVGVNARKKKNSRLYSAAFGLRLKMARALLDLCVNVDAEDDEGESQFNLVSSLLGRGFRDHVSAVRLLLERGMDVNLRKKNKTTLLHSAAFSGRAEMARLLLDHGAIADAENDEGETPLNLVSRGDYYFETDGVPIARLLLERGVDVDARKKNMSTPLHSAAFKGRVKVAQVLLDHGANADAENDDGETPLNLVSRGDYSSYSGGGVGVARLLLERGVDVNARKKNKTTPLHSAAFRGRLEMVQLLLDHDANADVYDDDHEIPLNLASRSGASDDDENHCVDIVQPLLERGVDVNARDKYHNTPLHTAAFKGESKIARILLDRGANPNAVNERGETLLHEVSRMESDSQGVGIARLLLDRGVDIHAQDKDHNTALHSAAFEGRLRVAQVLLEYGANADTKNDQGETPLHRASKGEHNSQEDRVGIAQLLLERGADVNGQKRNKWTPLHLAALKGRLEIARALLDHDANPNAEDEQGETPLHVVSQRKYDPQEGGIKVARLLLERGADVNAPDKDQYTPFDSASYFGRFDIARLFVEHGATDAEHASRGTKRKADDVGLGSRSEKKPKLYKEMHLAPWRHAHFTGIHA